VVAAQANVQLESCSGPVGHPEAAWPAIGAGSSKLQGYFPASGAGFRAPPDRDAQSRGLESGHCDTAECVQKSQKGPHAPIAPAPRSSPLAISGPSCNSWALASRRRHEWRKAAVRKSCSIRSARASARRGWAEKSPRCRGGSRSRTGRGDHRQARGHGFRKGPRAPMLRRGWAATKDSLRRNSCCTWFAGAPLRDRWGPKKRGIAQFHQLRNPPPGTRSAGPRLQQAASPPPATWRALAQAPPCPTISSRPKVGVSSAANHCSGTP